MLDIYANIMFFPNHTQKTKDLERIFPSILNITYYQKFLCSEVGLGIFKNKGV